MASHPAGSPRSGLWSPVGRYRLAVDGDQSLHQEFYVTSQATDLKHFEGFRRLADKPPFPHRPRRPAAGFRAVPEKAQVRKAPARGWRASWTLACGRTSGEASPMNDGLLEPKLTVGHVHQCTRGPR